MPEKPEVITVSKVLKDKIQSKQIIDCIVRHKNIIEYPDCESFIKEVKNQKIIDVTTRGKWIVIELNNYFMLVHLRMEGKFNFRELKEEWGKHDHVNFIFDDEEMRFNDVRKFGKIHLIEKLKINEIGPLKDLGLEYDDPKLTVDYLKEKMSKKTTPIKTVLLDQSIITGIGNIYDDEILFLSKIHPLTKTNELSEDDLKNIISNTKIVLEKAIKLGGTTIRSYTSSEGVHGKFQNELLVHSQKDKPCSFCSTIIEKIKVGGRGTYYCPNCQKQ